MLWFRKSSTPDQICAQICNSRNIPAYQSENGEVVCQALGYVNQ